MRNEERIEDFSVNYSQKNRSGKMGVLYIDNTTKINI